MIKFGHINKEDIPLYWDRLEPLLNKAVILDSDTYSIESVKLAVEQGTYAVWIAYDNDDNILGAITTRVMVVPSGKRGISLDFIGGARITDWIDMGQEMIENYAKEIKCDFIQGYGRRAWERYGSKLGYETLYTTYRKNL